MIYGISDNMDFIVQLGKYGAINAEDPTKMGYYVIKYLYKPYTLHEDRTIYGQVSKAGEPVVKSEYLSIMKAKQIGIGKIMKKIRV